MKRSHIILLTGSVLCILLLFLLVQFTSMPNEHKNGFTRRLLKSPITPLHQMKTEYQLEKIVGATRDHFFCSVPNPQWVIMIDKDLKKESSISFPVPMSKKVSTLHLCMVDSPWVYLHVNNIPALIYAQIGNGKLETVNLATSLFTKSVQISPWSMLVRAFDSTQKGQVFQLINTHTGQVVRQAAIIPQEKEDQGFSTDGTLQYDSLTKRLLFVQFYQNRFFCMDTNLNLQYIGRTIDTTNTNQVSIQQVEIDKEERLMPSAPRAR